MPTRKPQPVKSAPPAPAPVAEHQHVIDLSPSPEATEALSLRQRAEGLTIRDRSSHEQALEDVRMVKGLQRKIADHYKPIKQGIDALKRQVLDLERRDLAPGAYFLSVVEPMALAYADTQRRLEREAAERKRLEDEEQQRRVREAERDALEREALSREAASPDLSDREQRFVTAMLRDPNPYNAAVTAGFANPTAAAARLMGTPKIAAALGAARDAEALRRQAEAVAKRPITTTQRTVATQVGSVKGVTERTYYAAVVVDPHALIGLVLAGKVDRRALMPNQTFLNSEAEQLRETFESVYGPAVALKKTSGFAARG